MPSSDYTTTGGGLKLKGAKNAGIDKKRKKKSKPATDSTTTVSTTTTTTGASDSRNEPKDAMHSALAEEDADLGSGQGGKEAEFRVQKTEAERRHEELRRKRVLTTCL